MLAIIRALVAAAGPARPKQVYAWLEENGERQYAQLTDGVNARKHYENAVRFARQELADGEVLAKVKGIWALTDPEAARAMTAGDAVRMIGENRRKRERKKAEEAHPAESSDRSALLPPGPTTGPRPSRFEAIFRREDGPASTYVFRFAASDVWKIGYTGNVDVRLAHVNQHIPFELFDGGWSLALSADWPSQDMAYEMEQELFRQLSAQRTMFERVRCDKQNIDAAWKRALGIVTNEVAITPAPPPNLTA